jgi:hypothetical protein
MGVDVEVGNDVAVALGCTVRVGVGDGVAAAKTTGQALHTKKLRKQTTPASTRTEAMPPATSNF